MAFNRRYDLDSGDYIIDRTLTGPPKATSETGTVVEADGSVVSQSATVDIVPVTPIHVDLPSPNEPIVMSDGRVNHHWWRFFNQLYLRTGGVTDKVNYTPTRLLGAGTTDELTFIETHTPTLVMAINITMPVGSLTATGAVAEPALSNPVEAPSTGSIAFSSEKPTIP